MYFWQKELASINFQNISRITRAERNCLKLPVNMAYAGRCGHLGFLMSNMQYPFVVSGPDNNP